MGLILMLSRRLPTHEAAAGRTEVEQDGIDYIHLLVAAHGIDHVMDDALVQRELVGREVLRVVGAPQVHQPLDRHVAYDGVKGASDDEDGLRRWSGRSRIAYGERAKTHQLPDRGEDCPIIDVRRSHRHRRL